MKCNIAPHLSTKKYRPSLTYPQILQILRLVKTAPDLMDSPDLISLVGIMDRARVNIENSAIAPAYNLSAVNTADALEALGAATADIPAGLDHIELPASQEHSAVAKAFDKAAWWKVCYQKYKASPIQCSLEEIANAKEHMYLNDLFTDAELIAFEASTSSHTTGDI